MAAILPVCVTIDVSQSMSVNGGIDAVNACLPDLRQYILDDPIAGEIGRIGVVCFNGVAAPAMPLTDVSLVEFPHLTAEGGTSYGAALRATRTFIEDSLRSMGTHTQFYTPLVFFLTDGMPQDSVSEWGPEADLLKSGNYRANVFCFGFDDADPELLRRIGTTFLAKETDPVAAVRKAFTAIIGSLRSTSSSVQNGGGARVGFERSIMDDFDIFAGLPLDVSSNLSRV